MKINYKILPLVFILTVALFACEDDETAHIDPMIKGISGNVTETAGLLTAGSWNGALVGLREQRIKLLTMKTLIAAGKYSDDGYNLNDPALADKVVSETLQMVEFKIDSLWSANIRAPFDGIDTNSAGIVNLGTTAYNKANTDLAEAYAWIMEESEASSDVEFIANDFVNLQGSVEVLNGLAQLDEQSVIDYVNNLKGKFAEMKQQYADLASEVSSSPFFSMAQKQLYASLDQPLTNMETTIQGQITLATQDELDLIDRDLGALVYFTENNYTSPAQKPLIFGQISSITELRWLSEVAVAEDLNRDWVLTADIDAAETARWNQDDPNERFGFRPIIAPTSINFDGQFHIISGLHMSKVGGAEDENRSGMFAKIVNGSIRNLGLINIRMTKSPSAGGGNQGGTLVGWISGSGGVTKCFAEGTFVGAGSQTGGFIGRPQNLTGEISDCFAVVDVTVPENPFSSSFIGLPVAVVNMFNCYNLGFTDNKAIFGHGSGVTLNASGIYYDSQFVGSTELDRAGNLYTAATVVTLSDPGVTTNLPTADWGNLANFTGFSADTWEIRTETQFDANPRPYLKGFNYDGIKDFIVPEK